jgi:predicted extracellular nuclease
MSVSYNIFILDYNLKFKTVKIYELVVTYYRVSDGDVIIGEYIIVQSWGY